MTDPKDAPRDPAWYRNRWDELLDLLPTSDPEEAIEHVQALQVRALGEEADALENSGIADSGDAETVLENIFERLQELRRENQTLRRLQDLLEADSPDDAVEAVEALREHVDTLETRQQVLNEAGFDRPEHAVQALASMEDQLNDLYDEKEAAERSALNADLDVEGDTFDQLQALLAREEKLQRTLGVSSPDAVIEMVEGMTDQLEDLYQNRDAESSSDSIFAPPSAESTLPDQVEEEFGVSDPDALLTLVTNLQEQLDDLYADRQQFAEHNLNGADDAIRMLSSMQHQLESVYERREQMSEHGINGIDHALSMIESMEAQLSDLYDERRQLAQQGVENPDEAASRIQELEEKLTALKEEKTALREKRDRLQAQFDELEAGLGTDDPAAVSDLIDSMEAQLEAAYENRAALADPLPDDDPLLPETPVTQLDDLDDDALDALPAGVVGMDDDGTIRRANANARRWPDVEVDDAAALVGDDFFTDVAPATNNAHFRGRFEEDVDEGEMNERFFYTYVSQQGLPTNLVVRLYRHPDRSVNWIVFRIL